LPDFICMKQAPEQICREMGLTETQFRLYKSRAKAKFGELGKKLERKPAAQALNRSVELPRARTASA
jgi:hypothetical protein